MGKNIHYRILQQYLIAKKHSTEQNINFAKMSIANIVKHVCVNT